MGPSIFLSVGQSDKIEIVYGNGQLGTYGRSKLTFRSIGLKISHPLYRSILVGLIARSVYRSDNIGRFFIRHVNSIGQNRDISIGTSSVGHIRFTLTVHIAVGQVENSVRRVGRYGRFRRSGFADRSVGRELEYYMRIIWIKPRRFTNHIHCIDVYIFMILKF